MNAKNIIRNLAVSMAVWLLFALVYSVTHEEMTFTRTLTNHLGLCVAIIAVTGAYMVFMKEKA